MEFLPLKELLRYRKKLASLLAAPVTIDETFPADMAAHSNEVIARELAAIDQQIAERTVGAVPTPGKPEHRP